MNFLNRMFTGFTERLPYIELGTFPTPVRSLDNIKKSLDSGAVFVKCDDISGPKYGGNKVRKLEYIIADAKKRGARRLVTTGFIGSNHALATAVYGKARGFDVTLALFGSQNGDHVVKNLIADYNCGAQIAYYDTFENYEKNIQSLIDNCAICDGVQPYSIPAGGTSNIGLAGYVNAVLELKSQINNGEIPEPDMIFVPFGTMGTVAGLLIGIKLAKIKTKIVAVSVVPSFVANEVALIKLVSEGVSYFKTLDPLFPEIAISNDDYIIDNDQFGEAYGVSTLQTDCAVKNFKEKENIILDTVYSGKTAASFIKYISNKVNKDKVALFWNTKSSVFADELTQKRSDYPEWLKELLIKCE